MTIGIAPICFKCKHYIEDFRCAAFPKRIPQKILDSEFIHTKPYSGDNGIQFEPLEESE